jgi:hypothetical protein
MATRRIQYNPSLYEYNFLSTSPSIEIHQAPKMLIDNRLSVLRGSDACTVMTSSQGVLMRAAPAELRAPVNRCAGRLTIPEAVK